MEALRLTSLTQLGHPPPHSNSRGWLSHVFPPGRSASHFSASGAAAGPRAGQPTRPPLPTATHHEGITTR